MEFDDLKYLLVDLPGDIRAMKDAGDFDRMNRVIRMRLASDIPMPMRRRLELAQAMCELVPSAYPYTRDEAFGILNDTIADATYAELDHLRDIDAADWVYINGQERFRRNFMSNILKTRPEIAARVKDQHDLDYAKQNSAILDEAMAKMRDRGELAYRFRIRASVAVKEQFYRPGKKIRVHISVPIVGAQISDVNIIACNPAPVKISAPDYPQRTACFEGVFDADTVFSVEYEFTNRMKYVRPDSTKVLASQPNFYTHEQAPHIMFKPYIRELAQSIVGNEKNPLIKARLIYDYVTSKPIYSYMPPYFTIEDLPGFMATRMKGDCGVFALLFITLCRAVGVPARWQSGLYTTPIEIGMHDWAQFYVAPYGWLFVDCSFGNTAYHHDLEYRRDFYFGNLDPFRMVAASEFQHEFDPPRRFMRYDPYDNQDGEAEYEDRPLLNSELITNQEMIEITELK